MNMLLDVPASRKLRIALYSHDTMGLGHVRRNMLVARTIADSLPASCLLIAGTREAAAFTLPPGTDCLTLPGFFKETEGQYRPRHLDLALDEFVGLRAATIAAALDAFCPDVLVVDKAPRGALRELEPALKMLQARGSSYCVLGLRDVLDEAATVRREWRDAATADAIRDYYDAVWVYGDPKVFDQVREYAYPSEVAAKVRCTGYLARQARTTFSESDRADLLPIQLGPSDRLFLCMVGGGQDGAVLAETFAEVDFPPGTKGVILAGPFMPTEALQRVYQTAASKPRLRVLKFLTDPDLLLSLADRVIAMGGYNSICDVLSFEKRALIVPRTKPRREQFIRARRLEELGLIDMLDPQELNARALADWLARDDGPPVDVRERVDLSGRTRLPGLLVHAVAAPSRNGRQRRLGRELDDASP